MALPPADAALSRPRAHPGEAADRHVADRRVRLDAAGGCRRAAFPPVGAVALLMAADDRNAAERRHESRDAA